MNRSRAVQGVHLGAASFLFLTFGALIACEPPSGIPWSTGDSSLPAPDVPTRPVENVVQARVIRAVDGDTILLGDGTRVRYIGIDTPETVHPEKAPEYLGKEASAANRRLVEGRTVTLEYDLERRDRYGRTLAYVWLGDTLVNAYLVKHGFAKVTLYPPNMRYAAHLVVMEREAKENQRGMWAGTRNRVLTGSAPE